jgi:drug/metabolite transporter (DMT)-like permease
VILISVLQTFLQYALFYQGIHLVPASVAAVIIGSQPLFIAFIAHFFMPGDKLSLKKLLAFFIGIGGIVLVSFGRNGNGAGSSINFTGVILLVCVNIIAGFSNVLVARDGKKIPPLVLSSSSLMLGGIILLIVSIPLEGLTAMPHPLPYFASLAWLSILSAVAISIWFTLLKLPGAKVSELNFWKFLIPLAGALLAWLIIPGESPNASTIAGMIIIVGSLLIHAAIRGKSREIIGNPD